jgi:hypothetical protein
MEEMEELMNVEMRSLIKKLAKRYEINEKEAINYVQAEDNNGKKRGRPKIEKKVKGPRGRPPMEEKIRTSKVGEDLIERLIAKAKSEYMRE